MSHEPLIPIRPDETRSAPTQSGTLAKLDAFMAQHPWHPRVTAFIVYLIGLAIVTAAREHWPATYPALYPIIQCGPTCWLLWRYRRLTPELTLSFHWLAIPTAVVVVLVWMWLGIWIDRFSQIGFANVGTFTRDFFHGLIDPVYLKPYLNLKAKPFVDGMPPTVDYVSRGMRLLGMSLVVPLVEELFIRSLMLRSLHSFRRTMAGLLQFLADVPVIGEWVAGTEAGARAVREPPVFGREFLQTPLGALSMFGVFASTMVFMFSHARRDWLGAIFCGVAYCLLLSVTRKKGLGPVIWAHGLTNALLWGYTLWTGDWRFL